MTTATEHQTGTSATAETAKDTTGPTDFWAQVQAVDLSAISGETVNFYTLKEGDTILGDASDMVRRLRVAASREVAKLFSLQQEVGRKMDEHVDLHERSGNSGANHDCEGVRRELAVLIAEVKRLEKRVRYADGIFWASVKLDFPELEGKGSMFLAHGWKVGYQKQEPETRSGILIIGPDGAMNLGDALQSGARGSRRGSALDRFLRAFEFRG